MTIEKKLLLRLQFLARVITKEHQHLAITDQRLFDDGMHIPGFQNIDNDIDLAERIDAFVSRFCRLQDTLGDKLLPSLLAALGERPSAMIDNLDLAERLGLIQSAEQWMTIRNLRNQMVHEYVEDKLVLENALKTAHQFLPALTTCTQTMLHQMQKRAWLSE